MEEQIDHLVIVHLIDVSRGLFLRAWNAECQCVLERLTAVGTLVLYLQLSIILDDTYLGEVLVGSEQIVTLGYGSLFQ